MKALIVGLLLLVGVTANAQSPQKIVVSPQSVSLRGADSRQQLIISLTGGERDVDLTRDAKFAIEPANVASISSEGVLTPLADGAATVVVTANGQSLRIPVEVKDGTRHLPIDFENDIIPVLTSGACNSGPCHGKARGQNGFALSLFGFDPEFDHAALAKEGRGRRVFLPSPDQSLLLLKPLGLMPHGGGKRLEAGTAEYRLLKRWMDDAMPRRDPNAAKFTHITVSPTSRVLGAEAKQQIIVTAHFADGSTRDVTPLAAFQSNESAIASVDRKGLIATTGVTGEAAVMARYMGSIGVCTVSVPLAGNVPSNLYDTLPRQNYIDDLVWQKLKRLGLTPSEPAPDHAYLRRVYIDIIGRVPRLAETQEFLSDSAPDKRKKLVDKLLESPEYADHWANKWADLLRPNPYRVGIKTTLNYDNWIRSAFRKNQPYDQFVRELVTAKGGTWRNGAVTLFRDRREPDEITTIVSQLFLGIRLECAKCHQHPNEKWSQHDFFSFAAYFAKIARKGTGLSPPISGSEEFIYAGTKGSVKHPLTGVVLEPHPLYGDAPVDETVEDPRDVFANWLTGKDNTYFRWVIANRVWADMMGRGVTEPVDDLRASNPPSNPELLEALGVDLRDHGYDLKHLIRRIAASQVYSLSSLPSERNTVDTRNYSRYYRQRLRAEVLLDSVSQITGVSENFAAMPPESQSRQLWSHRIDSIFLDAFGRPDPNQDPPCERTPDTTIVQALHLMNSQSLYNKVTQDSGMAATLAASKKTPEEVVDKLYLTIFTRKPTTEETTLAVDYIKRDLNARRKAIQDLVWAMLNTPEFVFKN